MKIFFSAGEPSGDLHSASLIHALREQYSHLELSGFGGHHMQAAGCEILYPLAEYPVMGFLPVVAQIGRFLKLASEADRYFRQHRPDAVVLVDNPGFNWWIARRAKFHRIPVFYFLPPQIWAWATWRVAKMRRFVDHVMCSMPFESSWYHDRGVHATYTGHPYFDELRHQRVDGEFLAEYTSTPDSPVIGILPGSRTGEVSRIFPMYLRAAQRIARAFPAARFPVACLKPQHLEFVEQQIAAARPACDIQAYLGRTPEIIRASHVCMSKSGSVSLELLYHTKPSTILYQVTAFDYYAIYHPLRGIGMMAAKYITLVNLLADRELFPEFVSCGDVSESITRNILNWLENPAIHAQVVAELADLKARVAQPGATVRTALYILHVLGVALTRRVAA
jgi:lipid-A-disaccharide synthase